MIAIFIAGVVALATYTIGFVVFVDTLPLNPPILNDPDAVVVPTGGDGRLPVAVRIFESGVGARLLITGVDPNVTKADLKRRFGGEKRFRCCADLDYSAANTRSNAAVTAEWVRKHGYRRLVIVTASYHMPRSLAEFSSAMPNVTFEPWPIRPNGLDVEDWWNNSRTFRVLWREYAKYIAVLFLTRFATDSERNALDPAEVRAGTYRNYR